MIRSMTGFGRGEATDGIRTVNVEIKAVNHRYCEINVRIPRKYAFAEDLITKTAKKRISRGKVEIGISIISTAEEDTNVQVNIPAARQYFNAFREIQKTFDVRGDITLELLSSQPDVVKAAPPDINEDEVNKVFEEATAAAVDDLITMREREGEKLAADVLGRADKLESLLIVIEERLPGLTAIYAEKLRERIAELMANNVDSSALEDRIALESAILADKSDITEEVVRYKSHISQLRTLLTEESEEGNPIGKKLDFLMQEFNRETNTIGSKSNDLKISEHMLEMKSEIEKIREQIQNIE